MRLKWMSSEGSEDHEAPVVLMMDDGSDSARNYRASPSQALAADGSA